MNKTSHAIVRTLLLGTSCLSAAGLMVGGASAQPTGGQVVLGTATITDKGPNSTVIDQKTGKAIINWNSFSIGSGGSVQFNQPNAGSIALNRVLGGEASSIYGNLAANGQVWIINQNGILFGKGSTINVGGLIATTADITDSNFAAGNYSFSGGSGASVVNQGSIRTRNGGGVVLSGASVQNQGLIQADTGTVVLGGASAFTVDFVGDGLIKYAITQPAGNADNGQTGVTNSGTIAAAGGHVIMTARAAASVQDAVVNNSGMISATSAKLENGEVVLDGGDGDVATSGSIDASGTGRGQTGGSVAITGRNITVADGATINVSGDAGGGTVKIGGDAHGQGALANAQNTHVGRATITADATHTGNGGTLVVWSNGITDFSGIFSAKGGTLFGNGGFVETSGQHLHVSADARIDTTAPHGQTGTWLLDPATIIIAAGEGTSLVGGKDPLDHNPGGTDRIDPATITTALATTDVTLEASDLIEVDDDVIYASPHAFSLMSMGNITLYASIQNTQASGGGAINIVAGWDGTTAPEAILSTPNSYGADDGEEGRGEILFDGSYQNISVGAASGTTTIAGLDTVLVTNQDGNVQIGYHGAGGGDINVVMNGGLALLADSPAAETPDYAMIGNGALDGSVHGQITGDINIQLGGELILATCGCAGPGEVRTIGIGNASGIGDPLSTGNVVIISGDLNDLDDENGGFARIVVSDLGYGDVTVGHLNNQTPLEIGDTGNFTADHSLTLMSTGDLVIDGVLQNDGAGAITLVAGWDGIYDPSLIGHEGTYGNNDGTIIVDVGKGSEASVGTHSGALTLYGANLVIDGADGDAQVGYHGAGGGDIFVTMTGDVSVLASADSEFAGNAHLGNGSLHDGDVTGDITGNIFVTDGGNLLFLDGDGGVAWLGNAAGTGFTETGNVQILTGSGGIHENFLGADLQGGDFFFGFTDPEASPIFAGSLTYDSPHNFTFAGMGDINVMGSTQNAGTGAITFVAGWDGQTVGTAAQIEAAHAFGANGATITFLGDLDSAEVGTAHGLTNILTGGLVLSPNEGVHAQIGWHGAGGGDIHIVALGDLTLQGQANADEYAMIGNGSLTGDVSGAVSGNIDIHVGGATELFPGTDLNNAWIGNLSTATNNTGNILLVSGTFDDHNGAGPMLDSDLNNGDVTIGLTDASSPTEIDDDILYNSAHTFNLLLAGNARISGNIQNAGSGAINLIAGWDGHTLDPAHFLDAGVFGNGGHTVFVNNGPGADVSIGSAGGPTTVAAADITVLSSSAGSAAIGYRGTGGGAIHVVALNSVTVFTYYNGNTMAQIGNLATAPGAAATGNITIDAATLSVSAVWDHSIAAVGNIASLNGSESGNITINTHGGALNLGAGMAQAHAHIGNWTRNDTTGTSSGAITIDAGDISITSAKNGYSQIGNGAFRFGHDTGAVSGNITIHATSFLARAEDNTATQVRVGNLGEGPVSGDILIATTGDYTSFGDAGLVSVGNVYGAVDGTGNPVQGLATGNLTIQSGGVVDVEAFEGGVSRIETGGAASGSLSVTAAGDITVSAGFEEGLGSNSQALIGALTAGNGGVNVTVSSTHGSVNVTSFEPGASALIGNLMNGNLAGTISGTVSVSAANGNVTLSAADDATSIARIGNFGDNGATLAGNVTVLAGQQLNLSGASTAIGEIDLNEGAAAVITGNVSLSANTIIATSGATPVVGAALNIVQTGAGGAVGLSGNPLHFKASTLTLHGAGGNFFLASSGAVAIGSASLGTGGLTLTAGGAITQAGAITAASLNVSTTTGAITLTNSGNSFGTLTVLTHGSDNASLTDGTGLSVASANVGGTLTLAAGGAITQAGTIVANALNVSTTTGAITLNNAGNTFATLMVSTHGTDAAVFTDTAAVGIAGATVGGKLTLTAGGAISQSAAIQTGGLNFTTSSGAIALTNTGNAVTGMVQFNGPAAVTFYNTVATNVGATSAGGDLTILSKANLNVLGNIQSNTGAVTLLAGWDGTTTNAANFGNGGVFGNSNANLTIGGTGATGSVAVGSKSGTTSIYARQVNIAGANGNAQLGFHGTGGGAIVVRTTGDVNMGQSGTNSSMLGNGSFTSDVTGNITGDIDIRAGGNLNFNSSNVQFGNLAHSGTETGNITLLVTDVNGADSQFSGFLTNAIGGGDIILGFTGAGDQGPENAVNYNSSHSLTVLTAGNLVATGSIQNAGSGAVTLVAGWDGHTLSNFGNAGVAGNNGKGIVIGGSGAAGNVALGSAGGQTSVYGASLTLTAAHGYAQLGFNGHGSGAILVNVSGALTLTGGGAAGQFAQIGHGGFKTSGNNSGDISIKAGGDVTLASGAGQEAYVQIGHGGAESNSGASGGYSNVAAISVSGANVILNAGTGAAAYVQIGNGGYKVGVAITGGTATNGGNITITSAHTVALNGNVSAGAGADAYMQIGNGGGQSNLNPSASAGGTDSGDITVTAPNGAAGSVSVLAGLGANSYAQIGNGGYAANSGPGATLANWTITGNITVTDLALTGGNGGGNEFAQIGNGDASRNSTANVSGNIVIDANGQITYTNGAGLHSPATIGNFTGLGSITGTLAGATPPSEVTTNPVIIGVVSVNTADNNNNNGPNTITTINTTVLPAAQDANGGATNIQPPTATTTPGALASLENGGDSSEPNTADSATTLIADSLNGATSTSTSLIAGMLKQQNTTAGSNALHGVPPADQDFSSWGNEALWQ